MHKVSAALSTFLLLLCASATCFIAPTAIAQAVFTWGTPTYVNGDSDVATVTSRIWAHNFGDASASATINGVIFSGYASNSGNSNFTLTTVGSSIYQNTSAFGSSQAFYTALSDGYETMLRSATYWSGSLSNTQTMTLQNLTPGASYQIQFWVNDSRPSYHAGLYVSFADTFGNAANVFYNNGGNSLGQYVTGTFTAAATTQTIVLGPYSPQINGATLGLTAIPEPATTALSAGLAGLIGLIALRRRTAPHR